MRKLKDIDNVPDEVTVPISVTIPAGVVKWARKRASEQGRNLSNFVTDLLRQAIGTEKTGHAPGKPEPIPRASASQVEKLIRHGMETLTLALDTLKENGKK